MATTVSSVAAAVAPMSPTTTTTAGAAQQAAGASASAAAAGAASSSAAPTAAAAPAAAAAAATAASEVMTLEEYVERLGGPRKRVIRKLLVSANGMAAVKAMKSIRSWAYATFGDERRIKFVVMMTPEDVKANAEFIKMADQNEEVPGGSNNHNYANVDLIVDMAERTAVDGVWAGWGHASENPRLPESLAKSPHNISFLGPPSRAMRDLGDKIASTLIAQAAGVPVVPWSGSEVRVDYVPEQGIPEELYRQATVTSLEEARAALDKIGYPAMIKASEGGGGKGIRKVNAAADVEAALRQVMTEVPGSPIFIMKLVSNCHHLEVQIIGDQYGEAIALFGRDCTVQRRHQKVIEEGPISAAPADLLEQMEQAAVRLTKQVGYVGVGTVEYLYADGRYYFLELNPRLQVEHPVTEQITGVNLPAAQLQVAMGIPLGRVPDIRRLYGLEPYSSAPLDFAKSKPLPAKGHVIAVRITAENPDMGFKPTSGQIQDLQFRSSPHAWGYFSVSSSGGLHEYADSQFGHVFAWGPTRDEARKNALMALKDVSIRGDIRTPLEYLVKLLERDEFRRNTTHTGWLDALIAERQAAPLPSSPLVVVSAAICKAYSLVKRRLQTFCQQLERGQIPGPDMLRIEDSVEVIFENIKYQLVATRLSPDSYQLRMKQWECEVEVKPLGDGGLLMNVDGGAHVCYALEESEGMRLVLDGQTYLFTKEFDPSLLRTASAGKLVRFLLVSGQHVMPGTPYAEIEVMKMLYPLQVMHAGKIKLIKGEGTVLEAGDVLAMLELDDLSQIRRAQQFSGTFPSFKPPHTRNAKLHQAVRLALNSLRMILAGFPRPHMPRIIDELYRGLASHELALLEFQEILAALSGRIPKPLHERIADILRSYEQLRGGEFPGAEVDALLQQHQRGLASDAERRSFSSLCEKLLSLTAFYAKGRVGHKVGVVTSLFEDYLALEKHFQNRRREDALLVLRDQNRTDLRRVFDVALSHNFLGKKNLLIGSLMDRIAEEDAYEAFQEILHELAGLTGKGHAEVALRARQMLIRYRQPSFGQRRADVEYRLRMALQPGQMAEHVQGLVDQSSSLFDVLVTFFRHSNEALRQLAVEVYVRRSFKAYDVLTLESATEPHLTALWTFRLLEDAPALRKSPSSTNVGGDSTDDLFGRSQQELENPPPPPMRHGLMVVFNTLQDLAQKIDTVIAMFKRSQNMAHATSAGASSGGGGGGSGSNVSGGGGGGGGSGRSSPNPLVGGGGGTMSGSGSGSDLGPVPSSKSLHVLTVALLTDTTPDEQSLVSALSQLVSSRVEALRAAHVARFTVMQCKENHGSIDYYTFTEKLDYHENVNYRHIEPAMIFHLELKRLSQYNYQKVPTENRQVHLFYAEDIVPMLPRDERDCRFFIRCLVRQRELFASGGNSSLVDILSAEAEKMIMDSMQALDVAMSDPRHSHAQNHHIFLKIMTEVKYEPEKVKNIIRMLGDRHGQRLWKLRVTMVELSLRLKDMGAIRFFIVNPSGYKFHFYTYREVKERREPVLRSLISGGPYEGTPALHVYGKLDALQRRRFLAQNENTTYVYDFPDIFSRALRELWVMHHHRAKVLAAGGVSSVAMVASAAESEAEERVREGEYLECVELALSVDGKSLEEINRAPGENTLGMVVWRMTMRTPESPSSGRSIIVIANDITFQIGSFGLLEDRLFHRASELARREGLPRVYVAANSGARIGLATEVRDCFRIAWIDESQPQKGVAYLYLDDADYRRLCTGGKESANCERVPGVDGQWRIVDIIGKDDGLGVENLRGSGLIAGETSRAYEEIFTITLVTGRSVGIGAYLARLGQRVVQNEAPIILTGASALNKVLGREVYSSNVQLGGPQIMYTNGVSHISVNDELRGVIAILQWLTYVPVRSDAPLPVLSSSTAAADPVDRAIAFHPRKDVLYDPRHLIAGHNVNAHVWTSGLFDRDSWMETLAGWGKTVVVGRARLGGIPLGVIAVETRTVDKVTPADPANAESREQVLQQAGQVWFPDSAFKTAQAIRDFNHGEQLALMILANWRGFSGGMRDMFEEVLKFGSYIVDALREYRQPVFIYIPAGGELRGGAWVVLDPTINPTQMEMYAEPTSRGSVLEPSGTVEIKYRKRDLVKTMHRLDPILKQLAAELETASAAASTAAGSGAGSGGGSGSAKAGEKQSELKQSELTRIRKAMEEREMQLMPVYHAAALQFADLHDTPARMYAKGAIREVVPWARAREYFYWRLRRRLAEEQLRRRVIAVAPDAPMPTEAPFSVADLFALTTQGRAVAAAATSSGSWSGDREVLRWLEANAAQVETQVQSVRVAAMQRQLERLLKENADTASAVLAAALAAVEPTKRAAILKRLQ